MRVRAKGTRLSFVITYSQAGGHEIWLKSDVSAGRQSGDEILLDGC